jgi:hypothetical protein
MIGTDVCGAKAGVSDPTPGPINHNRFLEPLPYAIATGLAALERFCRRAGMTDVVSIVELPLWTSLALGLRERTGWKLVYDCMDEHSGLTILRQEMLGEETRLAQSADLVLASSHKLYDKHAPHAAHLIYLPNAADVSHFQRAKGGREFRRSFIRSWLLARSWSGLMPTSSGRPLWRVRNGALY